MPALLDVLALVGGLALLMLGGDLLVRGAVRLAERLGLSPMLIGLVIVGVGTSTPELAASVQAALAGSPGIALGNIVGSNIANGLLVLGLSALIAPILVESRTLWRDGGVGLVAALAMLAAAFTVGLTIPVAVLFLLALAAFIWRAYSQEKLAPPDHGAAFDRAVASEGFDPALVPHDKPSGSLAGAIAYFIAGLALIVTGGILLVDGAVAIAGALGVSEEVIGLTIVAAGTSAPELVTSIIAAFRKQNDIALGNVLGSNIYNILFIGGVTGLVAPGPVPGKIASLDLPLAALAALAVMVFAYTGGRLSRREGTALLAAYAAYLAFTAGLV